MKKISALCFLLVVLLLHAQATTHTVTVADFSFTPDPVPNVVVGDTIHFVWGSGTHTTTSTSVPPTAATWNSPINNTGTPAYDYPVTVAGTYTYQCNIHTTMTGTFTATGGTPAVCDTLDCDDSDLCTTDTCITDNCVNTPISCDDADSCTTDECNNGACLHTDIPGCPVGINELSSDQLHTFPNPVRDIVTVDGMHLNLSRVYMADISGKQVYDSGKINVSQHSIQTGTLPEGVYLLHVSTNAGQAVRKVLVRR